MARVSNKPLEQNPFHTIRDPETGRWIVVYPESSTSFASDQATAKAISVMVKQVSVAA